VNGTYNIQAKSKDINGSESEWGVLKVTIPRYKIFTKSNLQFLENYINLFPIIKKLINRLGLK
jgi:hypothetical protein